MRKLAFSVVFLVGLGAAFLISVPIAFADPNLIGWWNFDDGGGDIAGDSSGNGYDGTLVGGPTWIAEGSGYDGSGFLDFDGTDDYVDVNYVSEDAFLLPRYTVSMWFRRDTDNDERSVFSLFRPNAEGNWDDAWHGMLISLNRDEAGRIRYSHLFPFAAGGAAGSTYSIYSTPYTYGIGQWHHIAAVRDSNNSRLLYVDGEEVGSNTQDVGAFDEPLRLFIGAIRPGYLKAWDGAIDDVRIYNRSLSQTEILQVMNKIFIIEGTPVTVPEGYIGWFHISLAWEPDEPVEVSVAPLSGDTDITVLYGSTLHFDSTNYAVPQSVILVAAEDDDYLNETAVIRVSAVGYISVDVAAIEADNDPVPPVIYVDDDADGADDGSSWHDAFNYLQDALYAAANTGGEANNIRVAQGTYEPDRGQHQTPGDRTASFDLQSGVTLYGGFAGLGMPDPNVREPNLYQTILSGDLDANDVYVNDPRDLITEPTRAENSYHVVVSSYSDATAVIDGFTITGGNAMTSWPYGHGGGMFCYYNANCTVNNCTFLENTSRFGGGLAGNSGCDYLRVTDCTFLRNAASNNGGGIDLYQSHYVVLADCSFIGNVGISTGAGGMSIINSSSPTLTNCIFGENSADGYAGGIFNNGSSPTLTNCIFSDNSALNGGGGGMYNGYYSSPTLTNCTFSGNSANTEGGGMVNDYYSNPNITNCILWGNTAPAGAQIYNIETSFSAVTFSDVQGGFPGLGNIDADPCFVDPANGDYHLKSEGWSWDAERDRWTYDDVTSRCIDAGNPGSPLGDESLSVPDDPNNIWGQNLRIDMGAFGGTAEASIPPYDWAMLADLTNDGLVDLIDFAYQAADWLNSADSQPGDLSRDSLIGMDDLALLVEDWLTQTSWH
ncbi:MAG: right-handed parallel beta-helix repeat-containing protein [Phycisphaerae bacterium]|nr:right-handed parallel beta-helix repeat-containing protein [Phycisphaerae bacterium]MDD5380314.1 right-handed parallel beta-helix repeat-containing protein [Phycisphaerae bacterium]